MRRSMLFGVAPCLVAAAVTLSSREAKAGPYLGLDFDLGSAFQDHVDFSYGLGGRFGWKIYLPAPIWLLPEVGGHFMSFGVADQFSHAAEVFGGLRLGFDGIVQPNIFGHLGAGWVGASTLGPHADVGIGVDFQITRLFSLGLQVAYNTIVDTSSPDGDARWLSFGLNLGFDFTRPARERRP